ncbi:predicted protein [Naegleria gruberi]|uniref:Predicted protein n=1 Tax=Naegleria gruberi TaxID=5762 RepID=D2VP65_NAEGR|nr:uncharacterized protein NAEGRDRAFT_51156 [Naegleria gruberi]EFC41303.1 predicted protein [Naegleria gruberi]|eukprot:XP_002674047.1 predicted protein [Naegleria gruberi strain NEG-M]
MPQDKSELDCGKVLTNQDSGVGFSTINTSPPHQQSSDCISNMKENLIPEVKNNDELSASSITLAVPNIDCGSNTTKMPTTSTLVVDDIIKNRRNIDDKRSLENRGTRTASLSMPTTNYLFPSSKSNLIPILPKTKDQEKEKMQKNKLTFQNSRNSLFQNSNKTTYTKVEMNKQSNDKRGQTKIDHQPKNLELPSLASIVLTPNTPNSVSNVNIETDESEINPILESVPFFIFLKIGILKENSEPKYLEAYRALSQQNLFFMTSWFRNPLHGIIGASTILRHDMEKNSHSDKRKKRGRKNSILQSPSHSPMNAKKGFLHVSNDDGHYSSDCESSCGDSTAEQPYLELVNDIYNNANLLLHIFSTSLQMTSLEMGNIKLKNEPFNLLDTIESVISVFYNIAADKNVSLHSFINLNSLPNQVIGDHVRVSQILMNFVSNSIKYSSNEQGESSVILKCDICSDEELKKLNVEKEKIIEMLDDKEDIVFVKIDCIDNGKGIEKDNINKLFKAFQTFDLKSASNMDTGGTVFDQYYLKSISGNTKGSNGTSLLLSNRTGVGLNISKQLIEKMKGSIIVSSEIGKGTTMSVIFPLKIAPTQSAQNQRLEELSIDLEDFNVLIIDNDALFLDIMKDYVAHICAKTTVTTVIDPKSITDIDESKPLVVIYSEHLHAEVKQILKLVSVEKILIPIGLRGRTRKYATMKYIIKPVKVDDMISVLNEKLDKQKKKINCQNIITPPPEINITTDNVPTIEVVIPEPVPSKRILITDDNLINRKVMEKMVRLLGFTEVDCASNGLECFEMYKQKQYSIILLDLLMPVMCGKQSVKHIREFEESEGRKRTPVIAITANIWESVDTLSQLGFDSVIYKPILIEKLREEVERLTQESNS